MTAIGLPERPSSTPARHWPKATVRSPPTGVLRGGRLLDEVVPTSSELTDLGLEQLHLELRAGSGAGGLLRSAGLDGRRPLAGGLAAVAGHSRDEVLMFLALRQRPAA